jgi:flap endonuclease-1
MSQSSSGPNKQQPILEIDLEAALRGLELTFEQFVDLCILCGCDYCNTIKGVGPKTALKLIKQFKNIEGVVRYVQREKKKKYVLPKEWVRYKVKKGEPEEEEEEEEEQTEGEIVPTTSSPNTPAPVSTSDATISSGDVTVGETTATPAAGAGSSLSEDDVPLDEDEDEEHIVEEDDDEVLVEGDDEEETSTEQEEDPGEGFEWVHPTYIRARSLFMAHEVVPAEEVELKWVAPLEEELRAYLVERMGFNAERVDTGIKKLQEAQGKKAQQRMDR